MSKELYLSVGGRDFPIRRVSSTWQMMRFAKASEKANRRAPHPDSIVPGEGEDAAPVKKPCGCDKCEAVREGANAAGMELLSAMHDTAMIMLRPEARDEFREFMATAELAPQELENAIGEAIASIGGEAETVEGKAQEVQPSSSSQSEPSTSGKPRVVSLSRRQVVDSTATAAS